MAITVTINSIDRTDHISLGSLNVQLNLTDRVDTANFSYIKGAKTFVPSVTDEVEVIDGGVKVFGGQIINIDETVFAGGGALEYRIQCVDHTYEFDAELVAKTYENQTVKQIIDDIVSEYTDGSFTTSDVLSNFLIEKVVFNQVPPSSCIKRIVKVLDYHWYIDADKGIHLFPFFAESAPYDLTDDNGNLIYKTLEQKIEGTQIANRVVVRGGLYNEASAYTDEITVRGNSSSAFTLPYQMADLSIELDTGAGFVSQSVGIEFIDDFTSKDVLYDYSNASIRFAGALSDGDIIKFSGFRKIRVLAVSEDPTSIAQYGRRSKLVRDNSIESNTLARQRAQAEIAKYKDALTEFTFATKTPGLRAGMTIKLTSTSRSIDATYIIQSVTLRSIDSSSFEYRVQLVNTKSQEFQEMMASLLEPESRLDDEDEVSERLYIDIQDVVIDEEIENVTPFEDTQDILLEEEIELDPLGANTEPTWVLASYVPNPWPDDPKRNGLLNVSMKLT